MTDLRVNLSGIELKNPVIPASGVYGFGGEYLDFYDPNILGAIALKGTTELARFGNDTPRIAEWTSGMINSVGLQNPGIDAVIGEELPNLKKFYSGPVIANISGFSVEEYVRCCEKIDGLVDIIELNISCPNVHGGGASFGTDTKSAYEVVSAVRRVISRSKLYVKLTPNVTSISEIAVACESAGAEGLTLINTLKGMRIDIRGRKPVIANKIGGFSGRAIFPVALAMVYETYRAVSVPIIGVGGISTAGDVVEMMLAGATAIQVGAENLRNPMACPEIIDELPKLCETLGINNLVDIIGKCD